MRSAHSSLSTYSLLTLKQVLVNGVWMVISPARAIHHYPTREDNLLVCSSYIDASYMIAFTYPIFLIIICTVYAVLTRKIPEAFNESKHIGGLFTVMSPINTHIHTKLNRCSAYIEEITASVCVAHSPSLRSLAIMAKAPLPFTFSL